MRSITALTVLLAIPALADKDRDKEKRPRPQASFSIRLVEASSAAGASNDAADLIPVELKSMLRFRNYGLLDSGYIRGKNEEWLELTLAGNLVGRINYSVESIGVLLAHVVIRTPKPQGGEASTLLSTETTIKNGETVVLGASRMQAGTKALIVLLTAKIL